MGAFVWIVLIILILFVFRKKIQAWLQTAEGPIGRMRRRINGDQEDDVHENQDGYNYNHLPPNQQQQLQPLNNQAYYNQYPTQYAYPNYQHPNHQINQPYPPNNIPNPNYPQTSYQAPLNYPINPISPSNLYPVLPPVPTYKVTTSQLIQQNPYELKDSNQSKMNPYILDSGRLQKTTKI